MKNQRKYGYMLAAPLILSACTTPDIAPDVLAFSTAVTQTAAPISERLTQEVAAEEQRIVRRKIAAGESVYVTTPGCSVGMAGLVGMPERAGAPCALTPTYQNDLSRTQAAQMAGLMTGLSAYLASLQALASYDGAGAAQLSGTIVTQIGQLATSFDASGLQSISALLTARQAGISGTVGFATRQAKYAALRRTVTQADPAVTEIARILEAHFDAQPGNAVAAAAQRLRTAEDRARRLRGSGDPAAYAAALATLRSRVAEMETARQQSPSIALGAIASTHGALAARLAKPASGEELLSFLQQLDGLRTQLDP